MSYAIGVIVFSVGILLSIMIHEFGHFSTARHYGMKASRFFVGFGPTLWSTRRGETEFGVKALPFGGFVKIDGMTALEPVDPADESRAFYKQPPGRRVVVLCAGSFTHFVMAILLVFGIIAATGSDQLHPVPSTTVAQVEKCVPLKPADAECAKGSLPAPAYGKLKAGDRLVAVNKTVVSTYDEMSHLLQANPGKPLILTVVRDGRPVDVPLVPVGVQQGKNLVGKIVVTSLFIGSIIANLPSGILVDLTGRRIAIQIASLLLCTVSLASLGIVTGFAALCICLGLLGIANVMWHPAAISWLSIRLPKNRGYAMSVHSLFANLGDAAGPVAAGWMLLSLSWQHTAEINALACIACAVALGVFLIRGDSDAGMPRRPSAKAYWSGLALLLRDPAQWSFFLMAGCRTLTQTGLLAFLPLYLSHDLGLSPFAMGLAMMALQLGGLVATPFAGILSDRIGRRPIVLAGMGSTTVVVIALTFVRNPVIYVACVSILGFFMYATRPVIQSWQMDRSPPQLIASMTSAMFTVQALMSATAPLVGGLLADRFGLISVFYFLAASVLAANVLCLAIPKTEHGE